MFTNFKSLILASVALLTLSLNVFSTGVCTSDNENIFKNDIVKQNQEVADFEQETSFTEDDFPKTSEEYIEATDDNIDTLTDNSELSISETTGAELDEIEATATTAVVEAEVSATSVALDAAGPLGIAFMVAGVAYGIVETLRDKNSTTLDKVNAYIGWAMPLYSFIYNMVRMREKKAEFLKEIAAVNHVEYYKVTGVEQLTMDAILEKARIALEKMTNKDVAAVKKMMVGINQKISNQLSTKYLNNVDLLQKNVKQLFASQWIKASPVFAELIDFMHQSNEAGYILDTVIQDNQWHDLSIDGRADTTSVLGLDKFIYTVDKVILKDNPVVMKSNKLDNTWFIGGIAQPNNLMQAARYLVVSLRDTPNQDKGVQYKAHSLFTGSDLSTRVVALPETDDFVSAGWKIVTTEYTALNLSLSRAVDVSIPSIITGKTIQSCGLDAKASNFLLGKTVTKAIQCLGNIFQDYKYHFAAYNLDDTVQISVASGAIVSAPFDAFLQTYGRSFNHLMAQNKIKMINDFYAIKKDINERSCKLYADNAVKFLVHIDEAIFSAGKKTFLAVNNADEFGKSKSEGCWESCSNDSGHANISSDAGCVVKCFDGQCRVKYRYICEVLIYVPKKDTLAQLEMNRIRQQIKDEEYNCHKQKDDAPLVFAKQLTAQGNFYLDRSDSRVLFNEVFEGVKSVLVQRFVKDVKISLFEAAQDDITYSKTEQWAAEATASSQFNTDTWSASQATGAPTIKSVGATGEDLVNSWAESKEKRSMLNTLTLTYATAVLISEIVVRESFNAGSISKVEAFNNSTSSWDTIYSRKFGVERGGKKTGDENKSLISDAKITLDSRLPYLSDKIRITTGQLGVVEYNEIDAVKLIGFNRVYGY